MSEFSTYYNAENKKFSNAHPDLFRTVSQDMRDKRFLKLGDSWHGDKKLQKFLSSPALAAMFNAAAIGNVAIEFARQGADSYITTRLGNHSRRHEQGRLGREGWLKERRRFWDLVLTARRAWDEQYQIKGLRGKIQRLSKSTSKARHHLMRQFGGFGAAGLKVHACDNFQWMSPLVPGRGERLFLGDKEITDKISSLTPENGKTAIIYGASHFRYAGTMADELDPEESLHIDFYSSRRAYGNIRRHFTTFADQLPDYVYLVEERSLEAPDPELYGYSGAPVETPDSKSQDDPFQRLKFEVNAKYTRASSDDQTLKDSGIIALPTTPRHYFTLPAV